MCIRDSLSARRPSRRDLRRSQPAARRVLRCRSHGRQYEKCAPGGSRLPLGDLPARRHRIRSLRGVYQVAQSFSVARFFVSPFVSVVGSFVAFLPEAFMIPRHEHGRALRGFAFVAGVALVAVLTSPAAYAQLGGAANIGGAVTD